MVTIGNNNLPGTSTTVDSSSTTGVNVSAAAEVALVGQANLSNGTASENTVYEIRTPARARALFGNGSVLAEACVDALTEGAYPVYAAAAAPTSVSNEDISSLGQTSGTLDNFPVSEIAGDVTITVDGMTKTVNLIYQNPDDYIPATGTAYLNPVTGEFNLDATPSGSSDIDYVYFSYEAAIDAITAARRETMDVLGICTEDTSTVDYAHQAVKQMESQGNLAIVEAGTAVYINPTSYSATFDSSRIQQVYPTRTSTGDSVIGAMVGLRAALGINSSGTAKRLTSIKDLSLTLSKGEQESLVNAKVTPLADESAGARVVEDLTTVSDTNSEESQMKRVLHRFVVDFVTDVVQRNSQSFIGQLHTQSTRNALRGVVSSELNQLISLNVVTAYTLSVEEVDSLTASVDVGVELVTPLRNIQATILAGRVEGQATV
jgi:hypothetical protein